MNPLVNDRWRGTFEVKETGNYYYTLQAWIDRFKSWRQGFAKKVDVARCRSRPVGRVKAH